MKRKQFSEEQIIGILKEAEAGGGYGSVVAAWHVERDLLRREGQVRRP
ncbi:transposase [Novosphingobium sp. Rr 2-17]|nr:transposase [Novosphingobium sp. Rr 2-17]